MAVLPVSAPLPACTVPHSSQQYRVYQPFRPLPARRESRSLCTSAITGEAELLLSHCTPSLHIVSTFCPFIKTYLLLYRSDICTQFEKSTASAKLVKEHRRSHPHVASPTLWRPSSLFFLSNYLKITEQHTEAKTVFQHTVLER